MRRCVMLLSLVILGTSLALAGEDKDQGFESIFDGQTLKGWHVSAQTGHSRASQHQTGGRWVVEEGAIVGSQDIPGNGGILITDELFGDFEVVLEIMEWTDTQKRLGDKGGIALQVHGGGDLTKQFIRYRNLRVKRLEEAKQ